MFLMHIAIDIDDTLTNSFDYFIPFAAEYFGAEESDLRRRGAESLSSRAEQRIFMPILKKTPGRSWPGAEFSMTS